MEYGNPIDLSIYEEIKMVCNTDLILCLFSVFLINIIN